MIFKNSFYHSTRFFPNFVYEKIFYLIVNTLKLTSSIISDIPGSVYPGWLNYFASVPKQFILSIKIKPLENESILRKLETKKKSFSSTIQQNRRRQIYDLTPELALNQAEQFKQELMHGNQKAFLTKMNYFSLFKENANIKKDLSNQYISSHVDYLSQLDSFLESSGFKKSSYNQIFDLSTITSGLTMNFEMLNDQEKGIFYGKNLLNNTIILLDRFSLNNHNGVIIGTSGSGKSFTAKLEIMRSLMAGRNVFVIDPEGEYEGLCRNLNGQNLEISLGSTLPLSINSFTNNTDEVVSILRNLFHLLVPSLQDEEIGELDRVLMQLINLHGSLNVDKLTNMLNKTEIGRKINLKISRFTKGSCKNIFRFADKPLVDSSKTALTVFNIKEIPSEFKSFYMLTILNFLFIQLMDAKKPSMLFIDESWVLLRISSVSEYINALTKRLRKYNSGITFITQDVQDFLSNEFGKTIITNCSFKLFLRQESSSLKILQEKFLFNQVEKNFLLTASKGEGIMLVENRRIPCLIDFFNFEYKYFV